MFLETENLILRELTNDDFYNLCTILQDAQVMYAYEHPFSDKEVEEWLKKQLDRYSKYGFGLWAVILKNTNEFIGQCGITVQDIGARQILEIGYLFRKDFWHKGYATESAVRCKEYAFEELKAEEVYSIIRDNNIMSQRVAERNGMKPVGTIIKHYYGMDMKHIIYRSGKDDKK